MMQDRYTPTPGKYFVIEGFDPGLTTGYVRVAFGSDGISLLEEAHLTSLDDFTKACGDPIIPDIVVCEGFARGNTAVKEQLQTIELIGAIKMLASLAEAKLEIQMPAVRKGFVPVAKKILQSETDKTLKDVHHVIDALAHVLYYADKNGIYWNKQYWLQLTFGGKSFG